MAQEEKSPKELAAERHVSVMKAVFAGETKASIAGTKIVEAGDATAFLAAARRGDNADASDASDEVAPAEVEQEAPAAEEACATEDAPAEDLAPTTVRFESGDIVATILQMKDSVAVLDAASYRYPGGSYLKGRRGAEEDLCDGGNLYPVLEAFQESFYTPNRQTASGELYTSRALAVPDVVFTRNGEIVKASVAVIAAPNRKRALDRHRSERECELSLRERVASAMDILASFGAQTAIVTAFGCAEGNDAHEVARLIHEWLDAHDGFIPEIVFSIWRDSDRNAFKDAFADRWEEPAAEPVQVAEEPEEDDEEEDWEKYRISE
jgi:uncharacterized protein (TIGR02452 family)